MQFPESWLREFCDPPLTTAELAARMTMAGLEVESLRPVAPPFHGVVVARVLAVEAHPDADRLRVCRVDVGGVGGVGGAGSAEASSALTIVCGAPNVRAGMRVPCALVGAELPPAEEGGAPFRIGLGRIRGVESRGMLCSAKELKLSDDHGGLLVLDESAEIGTDLRRALDLDDTIFTLKLTPNLAHCLSVFGVAREVAALTGAPLREPRFAPVPPTTDDVLPVTIEAGASDLCGRFSGRVARGVDPTAPTPQWLAERLRRCGQRPVSALVDISNYVMFELGRPTHIFDLDRIHGGLVVRWGRAGERLALLNGSTVELDATVGVIADEREVESLAGIMGGAATAVSDRTRNVYVEAAFWWPEAVAGRSRRFGFSTDAGHRFERGVDPASTVEHIERITALIVEVCGGAAVHVGPVDDRVVNVPARPPVLLRAARAARVVGLPLTLADCEAAMRQLGLPFTRGDGGLAVRPPSWRFDLKIEEDLIEEVIRVVGYDRLSPQPPRGALRAAAVPESRRSPMRLRRACAALGYQETINFSFVDAAQETGLAGNAAPIRVVNPIASDRSVMRSSLVGSLVEVLRYNLARKAARLRVFELGKVFLADAQAPDADRSVAGVAQPLRLAGLAFGPAEPVQWGVAERPVDFYDVKGDVEALLTPAAVRFVAAPHPALHPGRSARIEVGGVAAGWVGELHPRWRQQYELPSSPVVFELDADLLATRALPSFTAVPRRQPAWRDLALVVGPTVSHDDLIDAVGASPAGPIYTASLFDLYAPAQPSADLGAGERSLAVRLELRDDELPLTDARIDAAVAGVVARLAERLGARLRR